MSSDVRVQVPPRAPKIKHSNQDSLWRCAKYVQMKPIVKLMGRYTPVSAQLEYRACTLNEASWPVNLITQRASAVTRPAKTAACPLCRHLTNRRGLEPGMSSRKMTLDDLLTTDKGTISRPQAANALGISLKTLARAIERGHIPVIRIGERDRISVPALRRLLELDAL